MTPNLPEAAALAGGPAPADEEAMAAAGAALRSTGAQAVLVKGGHLDGPESVDVLVDKDGVLRLPAPRVRTANTHGTGCTLSSAIAARLTLGDEVRPAVVAAKDYLTGALQAGAELQIGSGAGPVHHFHELWAPR